ncbi:MAG TPA: alpha/beta hydrolase [Dehalococcoidia bacterium]|nr:alpha/beta hydrolase [Dehalococcoidia bacterium]
MTVSHGTAKTLSRIRTAGMPARAEIEKMTYAATEYERINGIRIAYETKGTGFPMLMLHGFPRTRRGWDKIAPALSQRFTLVLVDRRGYGDTDRPADPATFDNGTIVSDHTTLMKRLGYRDYLVLGHDKGAAPAHRIALENQDHVPGLIMLDSMPQGVTIDRPRDTTGRLWYADFFRQRNFAERLIGQNPGLFISLFLERNPYLTAEEHEYYVRMFSRHGTMDCVLADYRAGAEIDPRYWQAVAESGKKMRTPVLALWGDRSPTAGPHVLEAWRMVAEDVDGGPVKDSAHYVQEEQPEFVVGQILAFANKLRI